MNVYTHATSEEQRQAVKLMDQLLGEPAKGEVSG
jgi:hypothetical protein